MVLFVASRCCRKAVPCLRTVLSVQLYWRAQLADRSDNAPDLLRGSRLKALMSSSSVMHMNYTEFNRDRN